VHNWSWTPASVAVPAPVRDVLSGASTPAGGSLELGSWDVVLLVEEGEDR
jgi:beta-galactosidase